jgi:hypothetical protein
MDMPVPSAVSDAVGPDGAVVVDVACRRCEYNLRGLPAAGLCPECATPVGRSISGDLLRFSDPEWVAKLAKGASLILWGILFALLTGCIAGILTASIGSPILGQLVATASGAVSYWGVWLVTTRDPSGIGEDREINARRIVRAALLLGMGGQLLTIMVPDFLSLFGLVFVIILVIMQLCAAVGEFFKFSYFEKLALRVPELSIAKRARLLKWLMVVVGGGAALSVGAGALGGFTGPPTPGTPANPLFAIMVASAVVFGILGMVLSVLTLLLLFRLRKMFAEQAELARCTWAKRV